MDPDEILEASVKLIGLLIQVGALLEKAAIGPGVTLIVLLILSIQPAAELMTNVTTKLPEVL